MNATIDIAAAQRDLRTAYLGGFAGQLASAAIWAVSAAVGTWGAPSHAMWLLFGGGMLIYPLTRLLLRLMGHSARLHPANPLGQLAMQLAFTVPIGFLLVGAVALHRPDWFYPAALIVVGAHYIPFIFLYGTRLFGALAALMIGAGTWLALMGPNQFSLGGWIGMGLLAGFAFAGRRLVNDELAPAQPSGVSRTKT